MVGIILGTLTQDSTGPSGWVVPTAFYGDPATLLYDNDDASYVEANRVTKDTATGSWLNNDAIHAPVTADASGIADMPWSARISATMVNTACSNMGLTLSFRDNESPTAGAAFDLVLSTSLPSDGVIRDYSGTIHRSDWSGFQTAVALGTMKCYITPTGDLEMPPPSGERRLIPALHELMLGDYSVGQTLPLDQASTTSTAQVLTPAITAITVPWPQGAVAVDHDFTRRTFKKWRV